MRDIVERLRMPDTGWAGYAEAIDVTVAEEGAAEIERLRAALEPFAKVGRDLVRVGAVVIPDGASAKYLRMDGIEARHFRAVAMALGDEQSSKEK